MDEHSRRSVLKTAATAAATAIAGGSLIGSASADGPYAEQPDHVTLRGYDDASDRLDTFEPRLVLRDLDIKPTALYCWEATSAEYDLDWLCYWAWYPSGQEGVTAEDTHVPDREPVYVGVDPDTDEITRVIYDDIHYFTGTTVPTTDRPRLYVINPWHPYEPTTEKGQLIDLRDLHDRYEDWLNVGWKVSRRAVVDPPYVQSRGHWWPDNSLGFSGTAIATRATIGLRNAGIPVPIPGRQT